MPRAYGITNANPYASAPAVGASGDTYWNTTSKTLYVSDGTQWVSVSAAAGDAVKATFTQNAHGFSKLQCLRLSGTTWVAALADTVANADVVGVVSSVIDANRFELTFSGRIVGGNPGQTGPRWLSDVLVLGSAGILMSAKPTTPGHVDKPVLFAMDPDSIVQIERGFVVPTPGSPSISLLTAAKGIVANGTQVAAPVAGAVLPVATVINGASAWLSSNTFTIPAGAGGLYLIEVAVNFTSPTVAAVGFSVRNTAGNDYSPQMMTGGMTAAGNPQNTFHGTWLRQCADFDSFRVYNSANPITGGTARVDRFSIIRIADALSTT